VYFIIKQLLYDFPKFFVYLNELKYKINYTAMNVTRNKVKHYICKKWNCFRHFCL